MSTGRNISAGGAFMRLFWQDDHFRRGLAATRARLQAYGRSLATVGAGLTGLATAAAAPFVPAITAAARMQETISKFNTVFAASAPIVQRWADDFAGNVGRSRQQIAAFLASTQDLLVPIGFEPGAAISFSQQITALAVDLASFNNVSDADALRDLQAALTGSSETMKKYGVIVNQTAVNQQLLSQGIDPRSATEQQKVFARLTRIMQGSKAAQGDALRTAGSFTNQLKRLRAEAENLAVAVGTPLLEPLAALASRASQIVQTISSWAQQNAQLVTTAAGVIVAVGAVGGALIAAGSALTLTGLSLSGFAGLLGAIGTAAAAVVSPLGLLTAALVAGGAALVRYTSIGQIALDFLRDRFGTLLDTSRRTISAIGAALSGGDLTLAARVLWAALRLEWTRGTNFLRATWTDWKFFFLQVFDEAVFTLAARFTAGWARLREIWASGTAFFANAWSLMIRQLTTLWNAFAASVSISLTAIRATIDRDFDFEAARTAIIRQAAAAEAAAESNFRDRLAATQSSKRDQLAAIAAERQAALEQLEAARTGRAAELFAAQQSALTEAETNLDRARTAWENAVAAATTAAAADRTQDATLADALRDQLAATGDQIGRGIQAAASRFTAAGVFGGQAAELIFAGFQSDDIPRQQLDAQRKANSDLAAIRDNTARPLTFSP